MMASDPKGTLSPLIEQLTELSELAMSYHLHEVRTSKKYVATMVDIANTLNKTSINDLLQIDLEEIKTQSGHLAYFQLKNIPEVIPCDADYFERLYSHFRRPLLLLLRKTKRSLGAPHRQVLSHLERDHAIEKVIQFHQFDVDLIMDSGEKEMNRYQNMSKLVRGGGRKLDILMHGLMVPAKVRTKVMLVARILEDQLHPKNHIGQHWLTHSSFRGDLGAFQTHFAHRLHRLENLAERLIVQVEDLAGIQLSRDLSELDMNRSWYTLGQTVGRGEGFFASFREDVAIENKIKRLTFTMARIAWDADRKNAEMDQIVLNEDAIAEKASKLSSLFFDLQQRIQQTIGEKSDVQQAVQHDFDSGLLSKKESHQAQAWVKANRLKLQELSLQVYEQLRRLKEEHPEIVIAAELEDAISELQTNISKAKESRSQEIIQNIANLNIDSFQGEWETILQEQPLDRRLNLIHSFQKKIDKQRQFISIENISFHREIRDSFSDLQSYEGKILELSTFEEALENLRNQTETHALDILFQADFSSIGDETILWLIECQNNRMYLNIRKTCYDDIDHTKTLEPRFKELRKRSGKDCVNGLDFLLQTLQNIPKVHQLLQGLSDWEKDQSPEEIEHKKSFIQENEERLQTLMDQIRNALREEIAHEEMPNRRLRFDVFGLSDVLADTLEINVNSLMTLTKKASSVQDLDHVLSGLKAIENQIIEAQKTVRQDGGAKKKLSQLQKKENIPASLLKQLEHDLEENYVLLDRLLPRVSQALKQVTLLQNRFGADKETDYLTITINDKDVDRLKGLYDFIDETNLDDIKRFCVVYNLKNRLLNDLFDGIANKDLAIPKELSKSINAKVIKGYQEKRFIPAQLKYQIYLQYKDIFEAESQLICHTLNLVKPHKVRAKAAYKGIISVLSLAKDGAPWVIKKLGLIWGRLQTRMHQFQPHNHKRNFEGNRTALTTDVREMAGEKFDLQL